MEAIAPPISARSEVTQVASLRPVHTAFKWLHLHEQEIRKWQIALTEIPAPPFGEGPRAEWLRQQFAALGLEDVRVDEVGNVIGIRHGSDRDSFVALSAHIDTVFPQTETVKVREEGAKLFAPGITDNAAGVTALFAIASALKHAEVQTGQSILFVGNVGEEGEGDLRGMRHLFSDPRWKEAITQTIVLDGSGVDNVVTSALGSRRYEITMRGPGGHSWSDYGIPNPIVLLSRAVARLSEIKLPQEPKTTMNAGVISGGTSVNSIPESASLRLDLRSVSAAELDKLEQQVRDTLGEVVREVTIQQRGNGKPQVSYEMKKIGDRPAAELHPQARILEVVRAVDAHLGNNVKTRRASTDANVPMSLGKQAISIGAGGSGGDAHTLHEWYDTTGRELGLKRILLLALTLTGVRE